MPAKKPTEVQSRIRRMAMGLKTRERAWKLTQPKNYTIRRVRRVVDGDCDFVEWGTVYEVDFAPKAQGLIPNFSTAAIFDTIAQADAHITERATALDGEDCLEWAFCGLPAPGSFVP